jgi:acetyltransferase-like isoleucine patch superfamily enzyme
MFPSDSHDDSQRGRVIFRRFKPVLLIGKAILSMFPKSVCELGLSMSRHLPTRFGIAIRYMFVARLARACGDNVAIFEGVYLFGLGNMEIGNNVSIHQMCYIDSTGGLKLGSDISIAHATTIMTTDHDYSDYSVNIRDAKCFLAPVEIKNDVWIGAGVRILSGVKIHAHCVVAAGAVVTHDVAENSLVAGVRARLLKNIPERIHESSFAVRP